MSRIREPRTEMHRRSIVKAVTWRLLAMLGTCLVGWWVTGSLKIGLNISLMDSVLKILGFYIHERIWQRVTWGLVDLDRVDGRGSGI